MIAMSSKFAGLMTAELVFPEKGVRRISRHGQGMLVEYYPNGTKLCDSYILVPAEGMWHNAVRGALYAAGLVHAFIGIAVISDTFMSAIEEITSDKLRTAISNDGEKTVVKVSVWNPTVANLTLLALGSSAPEILLSCIETVSTLDAEPGELGPSTIVGSAAFNLLVVSGICVVSVEQPKKIDQLGVFIITSTTSLLAYLWLVVTLSSWTKCVITITEAVITLCFFPVLIIVAYLQDKSCFVTKPSYASEGASTENDPDRTVTELRLQKIMGLLRDDCHAGDNVGSSLVDMARDSQNLFHRAKPSYFGRRKSCPSDFTDISVQLQTPCSPCSPLTVAKADTCPVILEWLTSSIHCPEGNVTTLTLLRHGPKTSTVTAKYETRDITAKKGKDYVAASGHVIMEKGENRACVTVKLLRNDTNEVHLSTSAKPTIGFAKTFKAGVKELECKAADTLCISVSENIGVRLGGTQQSVNFKVKSVQGSAVGGTDYIPVEIEQRITRNDQTTEVDIPILNTYSHQKSKTFSLVLTDIEGAETRCTTLTVSITEDPTTRIFVEHVEQLAVQQAEERNANAWGQQFIDCFAIEGDTTMDYLMHFLTIFWRLLGAAIPPPRYKGGWPAFVSALGLIELASLLGCVAGLKDPVTAITFVALGTSLPDTYASKTVAEEEDNADAAIGNVTGSNCVNVFLGLGLPWCIASVYKETKGEEYKYPAGDLVYSVVLFLCCALLGLGMLLANRYSYGGELGGPRRYLICFAFFLLWFFYIVMSSLKVYGYIGGGSSDGC